MKKIIILFLSLLVLCLAGCNKKTETATSSGTQSSSQSESVVTGPQESVQFALKGTVEQSTDFSNGYAIVKTKEEDSQNYWINKKGEVLAVLPSVVFSSGQTYSAKTSEIAGGFVMISDYSTTGYTTLCDIEGNVYKASDFGVTAFHPDALADRYIITSTVKEGENIKIGVLDSDMLWVLQPREDLAKNMGVTQINGAQKLGKVYEDYKVFGDKGGFDVRNGSNFTKNAKDLEAQIAKNLENWELQNGVYGYKIGEKFVPRVNLAKLINLDYKYMTLEVDGARFVDGKAPVIFGTHDAQKSFSLIDMSGNIVFKPVKFGYQIEKIEINDGYVLVLGEKGNNTILKIYDLKGKLKGKYENRELGGSTEYTFKEGIVKIVQSELTAEGVARTTWLYDVNFEKLF